MYNIVTVKNIKSLSELINNYIESGGTLREFVYRCYMSLPSLPRVDIFSQVFASKYNTVVDNYSKINWEFEIRDPILNTLVTVTSLRMMLIYEEQVERGEQSNADAAR